MKLTLTVLTYKGQPPPRDLSAVLDEAGGGIGRTDDNVLVLEDPEKFVSRQHAAITFDDGRFVLTDSSLAGTYVNESDVPLHNASMPLSDGAVIRIGEYEILAEVAEDPVAPAVPFPAAAPFPPAGEEDDFDIPEPYLGAEIDAAPDLSAEASPFAEHEDLSSPLRADHEGPAFRGSAFDHGSSFLNDSFVPPGADSGVKPFEEIPDDFDVDDFFSDDARDAPDISAPEESLDVSLDRLAGAAMPEPDADRRAVPSEVAAATPAPVPPRPATTSEQGRVPVDSAAFDAFLKGAGMGRGACEETPDEVMLKVGRMFRTLIDGVIAVLRTRAEFKSQCRVTMTTIRSADNNPLKFSTTVDEALRHLFSKQTGAFLEPVEAIDESFRDIMNHQLAMTAGIQAALTSLLARMDPKAFERQFEQGIVLQKKSKCWDAYTVAYPRFVEEAVEEFFGDAFVEAYEEQMRVLDSGLGKTK